VLSLLSLSEQMFRLSLLCRIALRYASDTFFPK